MPSPRRNRHNSRSPVQKHSSNRRRSRSPARKSPPSRRRSRSPVQKSSRRPRSPDRGHSSSRRSPQRNRSPRPERKEIKRESDQRPLFDATKKHSPNRRSPKESLPEPERNEEKMAGDQKVSKPSFEPSGKMDKDKKVSMPSFEPSGKLAADTNTFKGVVIKYNEPPEAAIPRLRWRLYPMKGEEVMQPFYVHRQSAYLVGRDRKIADFPVDHPSCSKQHAVLQYRAMPFERDGVQGRRTLPYIIDLGSANGTYLNSERIDPQRYYELKEQDILKFGYSQREYAVLHELSAEAKGGAELDEDIEKEDDLIDKEGAEERLIKQEEDYF